MAGTLTLRDVVKRRAALPGQVARQTQRKKRKKPPVTAPTAPQTDIEALNKATRAKQGKSAAQRALDTQQAEAKRLRDISARIRELEGR